MGSNNPPNRENNGLALSASSEESGQLVPVQSITATLPFPAVSSQQNVQSEPMQGNSCIGPITGSREDSRRSIRRPPKSLQGLLKFAMEATQAEDAPGNSDLAPMDEQRRQFLEEALKSLTVDVTEMLDNVIKVLTNSEKLNSIQEGDPLPDEVKNSFTILLDHVDDLDVANDFYKMGGFAMFPMCYSSKNADLRARASSVLGTLCQNNPFCQERALDCGLLHVLLNLVQQEQGTALTKCLYALSCASRGYEPACRELIAHGGCAILVELLNTPEPAAKTKAAFLIRYYCQHFSEAKKEFVRHNIIKIIAAQIKAGRDDSTEHLLSILQVLVANQDPKILRMCRDPRYNLKKVLEEHLQRPELSDDRFAEEKEYCHDLLRNVFGSTLFSNRAFVQDNVDEVHADR